MYSIMLTTALIVKMPDSFNDNLHYADRQDSYVWPNRSTDYGYECVSKNKGQSWGKVIF